MILHAILFGDCSKPHGERVWCDLNDLMAVISNIYLCSTNNGTHRCWKVFIFYLET